MVERADKFENSYVGCAGGDLTSPVYLFTLHYNTAQLSPAAFTSILFCREVVNIMHSTPSK